MIGSFKGTTSVRRLPAPEELDATQVARDPIVTVDDGIVTNHKCNNIEVAPYPLDYQCVAAPDVSNRRGTKCPPKNSAPRIVTDSGAEMTTLGSG